MSAQNRFINMSDLVAIIGDVHGCVDELIELDGLIPARARRYSVGDAIDRGPDSLGAVREMRERGYIMVRGNHDDKQVRFHHRCQMAAKQGKGRPGIADEIDEIERGLSSDDHAWLRSSPHYVRLPNQNLVIVHAGIPGDITFLPPQEDINRYSRKKRGKYNQLWYVRYVDEETGRMVGNVYSPRSGLIRWPEMYSGYLGHVIYGHEPYKQPEPVRDSHATGIDLACVFGGWLCAVLYEDGVEVDCITVHAHETYNHSYRDRLPFIQTC